MLGPDVISQAMSALSRKRPVFHSEADFQHALAWELQTAYPHAELRLEKRVATKPSVELDLLMTVDGQALGVELKYPRRRMVAEVGGEVFTLATGADDHGRYYALEDLARLERLVDLGVVASGAFLLLTNVPNLWSPPSSRRPVLYDEFRMHDGRVLSGTMRWGDWGAAGGRPSGSGAVTVRGTYELAWTDYSYLDSGQLRYLLIGVRR